MEVETIKKSQRETTLELENLGKRSGLIDASITNRIKKTKEQNRPRSKNVNRNNKEITKGDNSGDRKSRKEIRSHRCKHHQQNTRDRRENLRNRRFHRKH